MKTREKCNQKAWYRLLKVLYLTLFVVIYGLLGLATLDDAKWRELDLQDTIITCNTNWKNTGQPIIEFSAESIDMYLNDWSFDNGSFKYKEYFQRASNEFLEGDTITRSLGSIFAKCFFSEKLYTEKKDMPIDIVYLGQRLYELTHVYGYSKDDALSKAKIDLEKSELSDDMFDKLEFNGQVFAIEPNYKYLTFIWPLLAAFISCIFVWEFFRRIFYYIAFGSFLLEDYSMIIPKIRNFLRRHNT